METALSLFWIAVVAVLGPLLAGHEIELKELTGRGGRRTLVTWLSCFVLALLLVGLLGLAGIVSAEVAVGIGLVSAFGVLLPILRDSGQLSTPFGATILTHGAFGELGPVIAMAVLLGTRGALKSILVLLLFAVIAVGVTYASTRVMPESRLGRLVSAGQETTAQLTVRLVVLLVIALSLLAAAFEFDIVLGAFAAGFILRRVLPAGHASLEHKLDGLAFGLLIPVFFVTSGMAIDPSAVSAHPVVLLAFVVAIVVVRGGPVLVATLWQPRPDGTGPQFSPRDQPPGRAVRLDRVADHRRRHLGRGLERPDEPDEQLAARGRRGADGASPADDRDTPGTQRAESGPVPCGVRERVDRPRQPGSRPGRRGRRRGSARPCRFRRSRRPAAEPRTSVRAPSP
jgi:hypothetical protein